MAEGEGVVADTDVAAHLGFVIAAPVLAPATGLSALAILRHDAQTETGVPADESGGT